MAGGSGEAWYDLSTLEDKSQVDLRRAGLASDDDQGMLGLSAFALGEGPVDAARRSSASWPTRPRPEDASPPNFRRAPSTGPTETSCPLRGWQGRRRAPRGPEPPTKRGSDLTEAQHQQLMDTFDQGIAAGKAATDAEKEARKDAKLAAETERKVAPLRKAVKDGEAYRRKGLLESKNQAGRAGT